MITTYTTTGLYNDETGSCCEEGDKLTSVTYTKNGIKTTLENIYVTEITTCGCHILTSNGSELIPINNIITFEP